MSSSLSPERDTIDVTFQRGANRTQRTLRFTPQNVYSRSREAFAVYQDGRQIYKVYLQSNQLDRALADNFTAEDNGLPVATSNISPCTISGGSRRYQGFIETARFVSDGTFFSLQHGSGQFTSALRSVTDLRAAEHVVRACQAAVEVGLRDPQGFIRPTSTYEPIVFIDIHASSSQGQAEVLLQEAQRHLAAVRAAQR